MKKISTTYLLLSLLSILSVQAQDDKKLVKVIKLDARVNSDYEELAPTISGDGRTLFFVRGNHPSNFGSKQDIWMSKKINDSTWTEAKKLPWPINNYSHNVVCGTNHDGTVIYLSNIYDPKDSKIKDHLQGDKITMYPGISMSIFSAEKGWSYPREIKIEGFEKDKRANKAVRKNSHFFFHWVDASQEQLLISKHSTRDGARANEEDIFLYKREIRAEDTLYVYDQDLGDKINTENYETAPFLSADKKILYFTRRSRVINQDGKEIVDASIYYATRNNINEWANWSEPKLLYEGFNEAPGSAPGGLNSSYFDAYFTLHDTVRITKQRVIEEFDYGFFVSARPDKDNPEIKRFADIYQIILDAKYRLIIRTFGVDSYDEDTTELPAQVTLKGRTFSQDSEDDSLSTRNYDLQNNQIGAFTVYVNKPGYKGDTLNFEIGKEDYLTEKDVYLERAYTTRRETISGVLFAYAKNDLEISEVRKLERLITYLKANPDMEVSLGGYTDFIGTYASNVLLSQRRVNQVKTFLMNSGIGEERIHVRFYSEDKPLADDLNNTRSNEARRRSRRVVIEELNEKMNPEEVEKYKNYQNDDIAVQYIQKVGG